MSVLETWYNSAVPLKVKQPIIWLSVHAVFCFSFNIWKLPQFIFCNECMYDRVMFWNLAGTRQQHSYQVLLKVTRHMNPVLNKLCGEKYCGLDCVFVSTLVGFWHTEKVNVIVIATALKRVVVTGDESLCTSCCAYIWLLLFCYVCVHVQTINITFVSLLFSCFYWMMAHILLSLCVKVYGWCWSCNQWQIHPPPAHVGLPSLNGRHLNLKSHRSVC